MMSTIFAKSFILDAWYGSEYKPLQFFKKWILNIDHQSESNSVTKDLALL